MSTLRLKLFIKLHGMIWKLLLKVFILYYFVISYIVIKSITIDQKQTFIKLKKKVCWIKTQSHVFLKIKVFFTFFKLFKTEKAFTYKVKLSNY